MSIKSNPLKGYSGIACPYDVADDLKKQRQQLVDDFPPSQYLAAGKVAEVSFNKIRGGEKPIPEMQVDGWFAIMLSTFICQWLLR